MQQSFIARMLILASTIYLLHKSSDGHNAGIIIL